MRMLFVTLMLAVTALAQEKPAATGKPDPEKAAAAAPQLPTQGPPPKNLTKFPDGHVSANSEPSHTENYEIREVVAGDTLWGVATDVLKDGKLWPQIWEQNEHIVNPHWIYPKDKVLIRPITRITEAKPPEPEAPAPPPEEPVPPPQEQPAPTPPPQRRPYVVPPYPEPPATPGPVTIVNLAPPRVYPEVKDADLYCSGFIRSADVSNDIRVTRRFSSDEVLATAGDYVYVGKGLDDGVRPGNTYQVVRPTMNVSGPGGPAGGRILGKHYLEIAQVEIIIGQPDYALARVTQNCESIELGDLLIPFSRTDFPTLPSKRPFSGTMKASGQMPGSIVMTKMALLNSGSSFSNGQRTPNAQSSSLKVLDRGVVAENGVVYLDLGKDSGAKPGDLFIVFRDVKLKDGSTLRDAGESKTARTAVGELVLLKVEDRASTALVTYSDDVIVLGDVVERR